MADLDGLNITFSNGDVNPPPPNHAVFSNTLHNDSQSTINSTRNQHEFSLANLQSENTMLHKKIEYLQKIIKLKDNTIDDLNKKLISFSHHSREGSTATSSSSATTTNYLFGPAESLESGDSKELKELSGSSSTEYASTLDSPIGHQQQPQNTHLGTALVDSASSQTIWEIPQRSSNRTASSHSSKSSTHTSDNITPQHITHFHSQSRSATHTPTSSGHAIRKSISSTTSSHYSNDDGGGDEKEGYEFGNDYKNVNEDNKVADASNNLTLDIQNQLHYADMTLGSSPRKLSPNRRQMASASESIAKDRILEVNDNDDDDEDLHFGIVSTPEEPVYKKLGQDSLYSNSSTALDYLPLKTPVNCNFDSSVTDLPLATPVSDYSISSSSITGTPNNLQSDSTFMNPATTYQSSKQDRLALVPPTLPPHPPQPPHHPSIEILHSPQLQSRSRSQSQSQQQPLQPQKQIVHKAVEHTDDSEKFLLNSLKHCVIRIESLVDPQGLAVPIDTITNHVIAKSKKDSYKVSFLVYTDENPSQLTPIYRVKRSYVELLIMDKTVRPLVPSLPKLPDFQHVASLNCKFWAHSKKVIQNYINKLLNLLKSQNPLDQDNPIWKHFSNYFEFKMDTNDLDDPEYSVLNLQDKVCYLLYIRKNFTMKTYDFARLACHSETNELVINFLLAKSHEVLPLEEVGIFFKGQEVTIKRKKKFSANKSWSFFAESEYDASELCSKVNSWIESFSGPHTGDEVQDRATAEGRTKHNSEDSDHKSTSNDNLLSPSINTPWKIFKKSSKQIPPSPKPNHNSSSSNNNNSISNSSTHSLPSTPSKMMSSNSSTPSNNHNVNDVLNFKAMPYESNKLTAETNNTTNSNLMPISPLRHGSDKPVEALFQPIDETPRYFKSTLKYSFDLCPQYKLYGLSVPSIVFQSITFLYQQSGEGFEGIFRLNGMMSEVNKIQEIFNNQYDCELSKLSPVPDVHSIATLLKRYLRNLKDRLLTDDVASELCRIINNNDNHFKREQDRTEEEAEKETSGLILSPTTLLSPLSSGEFKQIYKHKVPQLNRNVLFALFKYLRDVLNMGKHNKMTVSAMSVLMGPNLTQSDGGGQICTVLLENFNQIFVQ
ncbi:hypothetical protein PMKS-003016 [Pichia membranifaciens]|uniref:Rho-GAP domain-containing protein n=1 Tax=Pichia membranifaciens TaxID=4926 RepID=A0A1Q2YJ15_9ASCO|nr:hypothetical protein PMKS-003016 [Pichia membranifaciens]